MSRDMAGCWKSSGDFVLSSCRFKGDRIECGVPALEDDFVGDSDLARSGGSISITLHHRAATVVEHQTRHAGPNIPALRASLSFRPCSMSSSSFLVRSSSSLSRFSPNSRMRNKKSFTSSDPSNSVFTDIMRSA